MAGDPTIFLKAGNPMIFMRADNPIFMTMNTAASMKMKVLKRAATGEDQLHPHQEGLPPLTTVQDILPLLRTISYH